MKDLLWPLHAAVNPSSYKREIFPEMGEVTVKILARINNSLELVCKKLAGWILVLFTLTISVQVTLRAVFPIRFHGRRMARLCCLSGWFFGGAGGSPAKVAFYY